MTVAHTRDLTRGFRNRAGSFLLVLTSDYERIDFVCLERYLPEADAAESRKTLTTPQARLRIRTLTVERRKPTAVHSSSGKVGGYRRSALLGGSEARLDRGTAEVVA